MNRCRWMIVIACVSVAGCTTSTSGGGRGLGEDRSTDAGRALARDSGAILGSDGGTARAIDAGAAGASDGGARDGGASPIPDETPTACASDVVAPPSAAACAAATLTCIDRCMDQACFDACLGRDPGMAACLDCLDDAFVSCANAAGCQAQWDPLVCCVDSCADPGSESCFTTTCAAEATAYDSCATAHEDACATSDMACFAR